ncbi:CcmD family protein [Mucilaginibacter sp. OK268]|nr:CcmD family protein [Mucilaginibacter sp. OK268]
MTINMKKLIFSLLLLMSCTAVMAQQAQQVEMADALRSSGKIYVVILTIVIIFAGLALYLFSMDRRLKKIEKEK